MATSSHPTYLRYELLRSLRNVRFLILSLALPLVLYLSVAGGQRHASFDGTSFPLYFMTAMATLGSMSSVLASGARVALDRSTGWTRQLRLTPLPTRSYFAAKVLFGYVMAVLTLLLLALSGSAFGVRLSAGTWLQVLGLFAVGLVPFTLLGIILGHVIAADSLGPAVGGITTLFALIGGAYGFQLATHGPMFQVMRALPSYWLVEAGKTAHGGHTWPAVGWLVISCWTLALIPLAVRSYRRDTQRV